MTPIVAFLSQSAAFQSGFVIILNKVIPNLSSCEAPM